MKADSKDMIYGDVWHKIALPINKSLRRSVVVSYITSKSLIRFKKGDVLICDATEHAISIGQTSANLLNDLWKRGVDLFCYPKLHSKVVILDTITIVGSANISEQSSSQLFETVLLSRSKKIRLAAVSMLTELKAKAKPLDDKQINKLLKIPVKRAGFPGNSGKRKKSLLDALREDDVLLYDYIIVLVEEGKTFPIRTLRTEVKKRNLPLPKGKNWEHYEEGYSRSLFQKQTRLFDIEHKKIIEFHVTSSEENETIVSIESITSYSLAFENQFKFNDQLITNLRRDERPPFSLSKDSDELCSLINSRIKKDIRFSKQLWNKEGWYLQPTDLLNIVNKQ
jgi:hypothetical protein